MNITTKSLTVETFFLKMCKNILFWKYVRTTRSYSATAELLVFENISLFRLDALAF